MANRAPKRAKRRPKRQYTDGFKTETVRLVRESGKPISAVAREMDLTESVLRKWVNGAERATGRRGPLTSLERDELEQAQGDPVADVLEPAVARSVSGGVGGTLPADGQGGRAPQVAGLLVAEVDRLADRIGDGIV